MLSEVQNCESGCVQSCSEKEFMSSKWAC